MLRARGIPALGSSGSSGSTFGDEQANEKPSEGGRESVTGKRGGGDGESDGAGGGRMGI